MKKLSIILCMLCVMLMANATLATTYYKNDVTPPWGKITIQGGTVSNNVTYVESENITVKIDASDDMCNKEEIKYYLSTSKITGSTVINENDWKSLADGDTAEVKLANTSGVHHVYVVFKDLNGNTSFVSTNQNQTLSFNVNGGTNAPKGIGTTRFYGEPFVVTSQMPKKDGSYFIGWSTDPMATAPSFRGGDIIPADMVIAGDTLYAVYTTEIENLPVVSEKLEVSDKVNLSIPYSNVEVNGNKSNYTGWKVLSENDDGSINLVSSGTPVTFYHGTNAQESIEALTTNFLTTLYDSNGFESSNLKEVFNSNYIKKDANGNPIVRALTAEDILKATRKNEMELGNAMNLTQISYRYLFDNDSDYWVATKNGSNNLYYIDSNGEVGTANSKEYGVRVVITVREDIRVAEKDKYSVWDIIECAEIAGLYNANDNLLASWDTLVNEYGLDVSYNSTIFDVNNGSLPETHLSNIINNNSELSEGAKLILGDGVTQIGDCAFGNCWLDSIKIPVGVTNIGNGAFYSAYISFIDVDIENNKYCSLDGILYSKDMKTIIKYPPNKPEEYFEIPASVTRIENYAFNECGLTSITIPNSVTSIGDGAFQWSYLTSIIIPDSVISMGNYVFSNCNQLRNVTIGNSVTSIGDDAFYDCWDLTSIEIPESVTSIGDSAFAMCFSLTSITIPESVTSIESYAFLDCSTLTSIEIPESVTSIGRNAFEGCSSLISITIPESVTSIGRSAFRGCSELKDITVDENNKYYSSVDDIVYSKDMKTVIIVLNTRVGSFTIPDSVTSIGDGAFDGCVGLTSIIIPDSTASIGEYAFSSCSSLKGITIPDNVTSIGDGAFHGCLGLTSIIIPDSTTSIGKRVFDWCLALTSVTFENTSGWFVTDDYEATSGTNVDVTNPSINATNLTSTHVMKYWKRN